MNPRAFDALTRQAPTFLNRRSALGLLTGTLLASVLHPAAACKPGHPCGGKNDDHGGDHGDGGSGHGNGGHGGGNKKNHKKDKQKACAKEGKAYAKALDGLCIATFYYDFVLAASCAACFDTCANHLVHCRKAETRTCTAECGREWGMPITFKG